ncbi:MAG: acylneuraminate cytidylyltransferase family protein [Candidatus Omnitrophica bacterium]|nr:acylneuraminate cytidylyltransferase family protein [Candidatus Omnitrophota bacterium]
MGGAERVLAVIPARGGSKGLPGKNVRLFAGLPLIAHSIRCAKMCSQIDRCVVSTDSADIAAVARQHGGEAPFLRPPELARDESPIWPVLQHALGAVEESERAAYAFVVLLDPTSPSREPSDVAEALRRLRATPAADGIIGVSRPEFNPIWHCVVERTGWMADLIEAGARYERRQDVPTVYRINGSLYLWRAEFVRRCEQPWRRSGRHLLYEIPEARAMSIDTVEEFGRAETLVNAGLIRLPWLDGSLVRPAGVA